MRYKFVWNGMAAFAMVFALLLSPNTVDAQRPSLGGLQVQINEILSGAQNFEVVSFGDNCRFCIDPQTLGLIEKDPGGFRIFGDPNSPGDGAILRFGDTDDCTIGIDPAGRGLLLRDRGCFIFENPDPLFPPLLSLDDRVGLSTSLNRNGQLVVSNIGSSGKDGVSIDLGGGGECIIEVDPLGLAGLLLRDPDGVRLLGRDIVNVERYAKHRRWIVSDLSGSERLHVVNYT